MSDWLSIEDVLNEYKKKEFADFLCKGLQPYDIAGKPIPPPHMQEKIISLRRYNGELQLYRKVKKKGVNKKDKIRIAKQLSEVLTNLQIEYKDINKRIKYLKSVIKKLNKELLIENRFSWETIEKPETPEQIKFLIAYLQDSIFKKDDINGIDETDSKNIEHCDEIKSLLKKVKPGLETLYNALKKDGLNRKDLIVNEDERRELFQENVLEEYNKNRSKYRFIGKEYLQDDKLCILTQNKEKRDFIGRLLRKIVQDKGLGLYGAQDLYNCYLTITD
jgi:hypothetical protein